MDWSVCSIDDDFNFLKMFLWYLRHFNNQILLLIDLDRFQQNEEERWCAQNIEWCLKQYVLHLLTSHVLLLSLNLLRTGAFNITLTL